MRLLFLIVLTILSSSNGFSQSVDAISEIDRARAADHLSKIQAMYPRLEATEGEAAVLDYAAQVAQNAGLTSRARSFEGFEDGHSFSHIVDVTVPGERPDTLIIAVPANHEVATPLSRDGSSAVAVALSFMQRLAKERPPVTVHFLFLGAERGPSSPYALGSRLFLSHFFAASPSAVLYLDFHGFSATPTIETGGRGRVTPAWMLKSLTHASRIAGVDARASQTRNQVFRAGLADAPPAISVYLADDIPAIGLSDVTGSTGQLEPSAWFGNVLSLLAAFTDQLGDGVKTTWDSHYLFFQNGPLFLIIGEQPYVVLLLVILAVTLAYALAFRHRVERYVRTVFRNIWNIPLLVLVMFVLFLAATLLVNGFLRLRNFPSLWHFTPLSYFFMKLFLTTFLFALAFQWLRKLPISRNGSFYSAATLIILLIDVFALGLFNIAYSFYFMWAFICAFFFSTFRYRLLKFFALLLSPLWLVVAAVNIFQIPELRAGRILLLSPLIGNVVVALVLLPFLLMTIRLDFLVRHPIVGRRSFAIKLLTAGSGMVTVAFVIFVIVFTPFDPAHPQPVRATESINVDTGRKELLLSSPAPLGTLTVRFGNSSYSISTRNRDHSVTLSYLAPDLSARTETDQFLARSKQTVVVSSPRRLYRLDLSLESDSPILIFDSLFPYRLSPSDQRARFETGLFPPNPFTLDFTVPATFTGNLTVYAALLGTSEPVSIDRPDMRVSGRTVYQGTLARIGQ